jgi:hypothetical protein
MKTSSLRCIAAVEVTEFVTAVRTFQDTKCIATNANWRGKGRRGHARKTITGDRGAEAVSWAVERTHAPGTEWPQHRRKRRKFTNLIVVNTAFFIFCRNFDTKKTSNDDESDDATLKTEVW